MKPSIEIIEVGVSRYAVCVYFGNGQTARLVDYHSSRKSAKRGALRLIAQLSWLSLSDCRMLADQIVGTEGRK